VTRRKRLARSPIAPVRLGKNPGEAGRLEKKHVIGASAIGAATVSYNRDQCSAPERCAAPTADDTLAAE